MPALPVPLLPVLPVVPVAPMPVLFKPVLPLGCVLGDMPVSFVLPAAPPVLMPDVAPVPLAVLLPLLLLAPVPADGVVRSLAVRALSLDVPADPLALVPVVPVLPVPP
jgi:hypothetical protein